MAGSTDNTTTRAAGLETTKATTSGAASPQPAGPRSAPPQAASYADDFERLRSIYGTDHGIFVLAVHSFIEKVMRSVRPELELPRRASDSGNDPTFADLVGAYRQFLIKRKGVLQEYNQLGALISEHRLTNNVRHEFGALTLLEAEAAVINFQAFCKASGITSAVLSDFSRGLERWRERKSVLDLEDRLIVASRENVSLVRSRSEALEALEKAQVLQGQVSELESKLRKKEAELESALQTAKSRDERVDSLRRKLFEERQELTAALTATLAKQAELEKDRKEAEEAELRASRYSTLTRTRREFEKSLKELTKEQLDAADQIAKGGDVLIRGGAGTGKTLVLLEGLRRSRRQISMDMDGARGDGLLTFSRTLVKYNAYISSVLNVAPGEVSLDTVDSFLNARLKQQFPGMQFYYPHDNALENLIVELLEPSQQADRGPAAGDAATGEQPAAGSHDDPYANISDAFPLSATELAFEAIEFIWANSITREEYCDELISRSGLRHSLDRDQRVAIWDLVHELGARLVEAGTVPRNLGCLLMLDKLEGRATGAGTGSAELSFGVAGDAAGGDGTLWPADAGNGAEARANAAGAGDGKNHPDPSAASPSETADDKKVFQTLYLDEVQDLPPVVLALLKALAGRLVMAGDFDQAIYGLRSPFARAGIDVRGRTRILETNFRTTRQMAALAGKFRKLAWGRELDGTDPESYRVGPPVGWRRCTEDDARDFIAERLRWYTDELGYQPENICILCPTKRVIADVIATVGELGLQAWETRQPDFDFETTPGVRISSLHSAKGLDFPVVILYLPYLWVSESSGDQTQEQQRRSLLYVALTRAMDHLDVITGPRFGSTPVEQALLAALAEVAGTEAGGS